NDEDDEHCQGHDHSKTCLGAFSAFVFPRPLKPIAWWKFDLPIDLSHGVFHRAPQIPPADVERHGKVAAIPLAIDVISTIPDLDPGELHQRNPLSRRS